MFWPGLGIAGIVLALDQTSKWVILAWLMDRPGIVPVTGFFNLVLVWNRGVSFGLFPAEGALGPWIWIGFASIVTLVLLVLLYRTRSIATGIAYGLIAGGAVGNAIDRGRFGAVVDFLDFHVLGWHWPAFNVADSGISVGVVVLILLSLFQKAEAPR
jgi:signal peptidase II